MKEFCTKCGRKLERVEIGAENFLLPTRHWLPRYNLRYEPYDKKTGKRNLAIALKCPRYSNNLAFMMFFGSENHDCTKVKLVKS